MLQFYGTKLHLTSPDRPQAHGRCEFFVGDLRKMLRVVQEEEVEGRFEDHVLVGTALLNAQPQDPCGLSASDMFLGRPQW